MAKIAAVALFATGASAFSLVPPVPAAGHTVSRKCAATMNEGGGSEYEKYLSQRGEASMERAQEEYKTFKTLSLEDEFDGGDSGSGAVGDGNVDLEDQHNSATLGALRGGVSDLTGMSAEVGRGTVKGATEARTAAAGANYFGRSTGLAEKLIEDITEEDIKSGKMDCVRAQQKENWQNQRAIHAMNRAQGQGVVFGEDQKLRPREGGFQAQEALEAANKGIVEGEVSQRQLADHLKNLKSAAAARLDGEEWSEVKLQEEDEITQTFEVRASPRQTSVTTITVKNDYNTFAPFQCDFAPGSSAAFSHSPEHGSMNRRSGEPVEVVVRFSPTDVGMQEAMLIFETEDMRKVYHFIGST